MRIIDLETINQAMNNETQFVLRCEEVFHDKVSSAAAEDTLSWNTSSQRRTNCVSLFMAWLMVSRSMIRIKPLLSRGG